MKCYRYIGVLWSLVCFFVQKNTAQNIRYFDPSEIDTGYIELLPHATMYIDTSRELTIEKVRGRPIFAAEGLSNMDRMAGLFKYPIWVKLQIKGSDPNGYYGDIALHIQMGMNYQLFEISGNSLYETKGGIDSPISNGQLHFTKHAFPLHLIDTSLCEVYIRLNGYESEKPSFRLTKASTLFDQHMRTAYSWRYETRLLVVLSGLFIITALFFFLQYFQYNEKYILYYSIYLFMLGINQLGIYEYRTQEAIIWERFYYTDHLQAIQNNTIWLFFAFYLKELLSITRDSHLFKWYRIFLISIFFSLFIKITLLVLYACFNMRIDFSYFSLTMFPSSMTGIILGYYIFKTSNRVYKLVGSGVLILAVACTVFAIIIVLDWGGHYHLIPQIAVIIETMFLNLAIGQRMKDASMALITTKNNLLQEEKNRLRIEQQLNQELNILVNEKTEEIVRSTEDLAFQEKLKIEAEFNQKIANAELKALKAQMNPHFIFNCLNAINNMVQKGDNEKATDYLTDFSSFIRRILSYSEIKQITLEEELNLCELYLKMEKLRFKDEFNYKINVNQDTVIDFVKVPPLILQPLLENAIWHGLLHKQGQRLLFINIRQSKTHVICTIEDNGVGREAARYVQNNDNKISLGLRLFHERLEISNQLLQRDYSYEVIDMYQNQSAVGTKVNLFFEI